MCEGINFKEENKYKNVKKNLSKIKYFHCYSKRNYANKYPTKKNGQNDNQSKME